MNALNKPQVTSNKPTNSFQEWIDESIKGLERMSKDEAYRQEVASRATNWAKNISPELQAELDLLQKRREGYLKQNQEWVDELNERLGDKA